MKISYFFILSVLSLFAGNVRALADCSNLQASTNFSADLKKCEQEFSDLTVAFEAVHYPANFGDLSQDCWDAMSYNVCNLVVRASNHARSKLMETYELGIYQRVMQYIEDIALLKVQEDASQKKLKLVQEQMKKYGENFKSILDEAIMLEREIVIVQSSMVNSGQGNAENLEPYLSLEQQMASILDRLVRYDRVSD